MKVKSYLHALFLKVKNRKPENQNIFFFVWPNKFFSSPGRSPGRAIALLPALALAMASASTFTLLKFFKTLYFPNCTMDLVHI